MVTTRLRWCLACAVLFGGALLFPANAAGSDGPPRYRLSPGQHLVFEGDEVAKTQSGAIGLRRKTDVFVIRANADGSWRLIVEQRQTRFFDRNGTMDDQPERLERYVVDLHPDGTIPQRASDSFGVLNRLFPRLPRDAEEAREGWKFTAADVNFDCRPIAADESAAASRWRFELEPTSIMWTLNGFAARYVYEFDRERGVFPLVEVQHRVRTRDTRKGAERITREDAMDAGERAKVAAEIDRAEAAEDSYDDAMREITDRVDPDQVAGRFDAAVTRLQEARDQIKSEMLRAHLDRKIQGHYASKARTIARVHQRAQIVGRPAPTWSLSDFDGKTHGLTDYRGKVVVLDFWYRACGWCMRAIPQVEEVARRFEGRRVAVLGMNTDRNESDARYVLDNVSIGYPNLMADRNLAAAHGVQAYPTLFVIDGAGVVRLMHRGYSGSLSDELTELIEELLAEME